MAQACGASNNGHVNHDLNARREATPDVTAGAELTIIQSALEDSRRVT